MFKTDRPFRRRIAASLLAALASSAAPPATAQGDMTGASPSPSSLPSRSAATGGLGYSDMADLVLAAPLIADATIGSAVRIKGAEAAGLAPGAARFYVEATVAALIRGAAGLPPRIGYVLDVPLDARGRPPRLKKQRVLLFARAVPGATDQVQLVGARGQLDWTPTIDAQARAVAQAVVAADAPPVVTGVGSAFHVAGSLPGEGETQIFLQTADRRPVSLSILRRPGEAPRWSVALGEIVDDAGAPPAPDTLLRYRLACGLPPALPAAATTALAVADAAAAQEDYAVVVEGLGPCGRTGGVTGGVTGSSTGSSTGGVTPPPATDR